MNRELLIEPYEITYRSILNGNVEEAKLYQPMEVAENLYIKPLLGKSLYNKIYDDVKTNSLSGIYEEIYYDYIIKLYKHATLASFFQSGSYIVDNSGVTKHQSESTVTVNKGEVDYLVKAEMGHYRDYRDQFILFCDKNEIDIPEWEVDNKVNDDVAYVGNLSFLKNKGR